MAKMKQKAEKAEKAGRQGARKKRVECHVKAFQCTLHTFRRCVLCDARGLNVCVYLCVGLENAIKAMHKIRQQKKTRTYTLTKSERAKKIGWNSSGMTAGDKKNNNRQGEFSNFKYLVFRQGPLFPRLITETYFTLKFSCFVLIKYHIFL